MMNRREFIKFSGAGIFTLFLSGCGLSMLPGENTDNAKAATNIEGENMKIVVITGSPHRNGTSALLADKFIEGAQSVGHTVYRFNAAFEDIHPCLGCNRCGRNGVCIQGDAIEKDLMPHLLEADLIVLITPLYYYGMSTQIKTVIDRFYARIEKLQNKKSILMATAWNSADWTMSSLVKHYESLVQYMKWQDIGKVLAIGCGYRSAIERSDFPNQAYQMGVNI